MTSPTRLATVESIYDARASKYDSEEGGPHVTQAADYLRWMDLAPGLKILDLACGTGGITIPAAKAIGASGEIIGVDISGASLAIARSKAEQESVKVKFIYHDIAALDDVEEIKGKEFDLITCGSAVALLQHPADAVKGWAKLLKKGGRMIFDVPTRDSMITGYVLNIVANKLDVSLPFDQTALGTLESVRRLVDDAGLDSSGSFTTGSYRDTTVSVENADEMFEARLSKKEWFGRVYAGFDDPAVREKAKEMFVAEIKKLADGEGKIMQQLRYSMAVGQKK